MKNKWWLSLFFVLLHAPGVWANGGPVAWTGTTPLGAIGLKDNPSVSLTSEHLKIDVLDLNTYGVKAVYRLKSSAAVKNLKFGVPINWTSSEFQEPDPATLAKGPGQPPPAAVAKRIAEVSRQIRITVNGKTARCRPVFDRHAFAFATKEDATPGPYTQVAAWCVTKINLEKGSNRINLAYRAQLDFEDLVYSKSALTEFSDRGLTYLLYPAGYWNGVAGEIHISFNPGPYYGYTKIQQPVGFTKHKTRWVWSGKNVDLKKIRKVAILFDHRVVDADQLATWNKRADVKFNKMATADASSHLAATGASTYRAANVLDGDPHTAWCEGVPGPGVGQYLEFHSKAPSFAKSIKDFCTLEGLVVSAGYLKSQRIYMLNNRVSRIAISDCQGGHRAEIPLKAVGSDYRFGTALIRPHLDFIPNASCFRVEILDTVPGHVDDSCISEVSLVVNCD